MSLGFLEANKIANSENEFKAVTFVLASSCQTEKLDVFIKAHCILNGFNCQYTTLAFNTLQQYISTTPSISTTHVFIIFPWDILPEADWRTGVSKSDLTMDEVANRVEGFISQLKRFKSSSVLYIPAKMLPVNLNRELNSRIEQQLTLSFQNISAKILSAKYFSLSSYLSNGSAFSSKYLSDIASEVSNTFKKSFIAKKILITDLDNVMWKGLISEDGSDSIKCEQDGAGYVHYIYQTLLLKLKSQGVLLACVTRNDNATVLKPFNENKTLLKADDFIDIIASYHPKSSQIKNLLAQLNLPEDSAVFVDDNPIELEEVKKQLTAISCLAFPEKNELFPELIMQLQHCFDIHTITDDDKNRTELYKTRYKSINISNEAGADLTEYLASLKMQLTIRESNAANYQRSLQLINKTNQFNLNGIRTTDAELNQLLHQDTTLYSFYLKDKFGDHGQIAIITLSEDNYVQHFVLSCRVFQRKIENIIIQWLISHHGLSELKFNYTPTAKNIPFQMFIKDNAHSKNDDGSLSLELSSYEKENSQSSNLFNIIVDN